MEQIPLVEFDDDKTAIVEPTIIYKNVSPPEHCVMPIYRNVIEKLRSNGQLDKMFEIETPLVPIDVYKLVFGGRLVTVVNPGVGAAQTSFLTPTTQECQEINSVRSDIPHNKFRRLDFPANSLGLSGEFPGGIH